MLEVAPLHPCEDLVTIIEQGGSPAANVPPDLIKDTTTQTFVKDVIEESKRQAEELTNKGKAALKILGPKAQLLEILADFLLTRKS